MTAQFRFRSQASWDVLALGEVLLRLDPGDVRIHTTRTFGVWEGGGEYNVARSAARVFGLRACIVTALVDNPIGHLVDDLIRQGGVDRQILWRPFDGVGRATRNGLTFVERGFGVRGAVGVYDRGHTAASQLQADDVDWDVIMSRGVRWFHTGGVFAALSDTTPEAIVTAMQSARKHGAVISYDLNYRASLWKVGGLGRARDVNRRIAGLVDVLVGNEEDFTAALGYELPGAEDDYSDLDPGKYEAMIGQLVAEFPNVRVVATTLRHVRSATRNDWGALCWANGAFHHATPRRELEILDRVGGGDSFAAGLIYAFLSGKSAQHAVEYGAAHGALAMTTPGDTSMATLDEVERLISGLSPRVQR